MVGGSPIVSLTGMILSSFRSTHHMTIRPFLLPFVLVVGCETSPINQNPVELLYRRSIDGRIVQLRVKVDTVNSTVKLLDDGGIVEFTRKEVNGDGVFEKSGCTVYSSVRWECSDEVTIYDSRSRISTVNEWRGDDLTVYHHYRTFDLGRWKDTLMIYKYDFDANKKPSKFDRILNIIKE